MPAKSRVQYTIRGIPPELDRELRRKAHQRKISLNQLLVDELASAMGAAPARQRRSLARVAGRWTEEPEFDRALEEHRKIDWSLWK
jgi:hypothetical protein